MSTPNLITLFRIILQFIVIAFLLADKKEFIISALVIYIISIILDKIDGIYARTKKEITDFGKYFDITVDRMVQLSMLICFVVLINELLAPAVILILFRDLASAGMRQFTAYKGIFMKGGIFGDLKATFEMIGIFLSFAFLILGFQPFYILIHIFLYLSAISGFISLYFYFKKNWEAFKKSFDVN